MTRFNISGRELHICRYETAGAEEDRYYIITSVNKDIYIESEDRNYQIISERRILYIYAQNKYTISYEEKATHITE